MIVALAVAAVLLAIFLVVLALSLAVIAGDADRELERARRDRDDEVTGWDG